MTSPDPFGGLAVAGRFSQMPLAGYRPTAAQTKAQDLISVRPQSDPLHKPAEDAVAAAQITAKVLDAMAVSCWTLAYQAEDNRRGAVWSLVACHFADAARTADLRVDQMREDPTR